MTLGEATRKVLRKHVGDLKTGLLLRALADVCREVGEDLEKRAGGKQLPVAKELYLLACDLDDLADGTKV